LNLAIISGYQLSFEQQGRRSPSLTLATAGLEEPGARRLYMANPDLHFFFLQDPATDPSGTAGAAAKYVNAIPIRSVQEMVFRIFGRIGQTNGRIKTLAIMGHGLDDPSGPDDPAMFISIGEDMITAESVLKNGYLWMLASYFQHDAVVRLSGCKGAGQVKEMIAGDIHTHVPRQRRCIPR
jgi:hypothetical protein